MRKDLYDSLTEVQRVLYDEHFLFYKKLSDQLEQINAILMAIVKEANL